MIVQFLIDFTFLILTKILTFAPEGIWAVDFSSASFFIDAFKVVGYFLPIGTITQILTIVLSLAMIRAFVAVVRAIFGLIAFL